MRCLRPDRIIFATTAFIINNLGQKYTEPPVLDLNSVLADSQPDLPLIFVLSPGVDPTNQLSQLGEAKGIPFSSIALGQGQARAAECHSDWIASLISARARHVPLIASSCAAECLLHHVPLIASLITCRRVPL